MVLPACSAGLVRNYSETAFRAPPELSVGAERTRGRSMTEKPDAVVIGGGHNGLACACYLAMAGLDVLVVEQYRVVGGMTITEEVAAPGTPRNSPCGSSGPR
jgi:NADPH-dependent 2,4-dienoyl-CoA reductase/sulfur reductase-like enzyme